MRTKGEAEAAIRQLGFPGYAVLRPSLIDAERTESRPGERLALGLARTLRPLIPERWRAVPAAAIAQALLDGVLAPSPTSRVVESAEIQRLQS